MVEAYLSRKSGTYAETAKLFGVGDATVSRNLRRYRETGDVLYKPKGRKDQRRVDLAWLAEHLVAHPDARLRDRVDAWQHHSGLRVGLTAMWKAVRACGWTHKKRPRSRVSKTGQR